jgi:hypothetical protein
MYRIVCVSGESNRHSTVAFGFCDEAGAWETAQTWISRRFSMRHTITAKNAGGCSIRNGKYAGS